MRVVIVASDQSKCDEISVRDLVAADVGPAVCPLRITLLDKVFEKGDTGL